MKQAANKKSLTVGHPPTHNPHGPFKAITASDNVNVNGSPVVRKNDKFPAHSPSFVPNTKIIKGSSSVNVNGRAFSRMNDKLQCGDKIKKGSKNVLVGG